MLIVLVHVAGITMYRLGTDPDMSDYMMLFAVFETIAHNGTIFFALISGLLYSTVLAGRTWPNFFRGKALNVIFPYVFFSLIFTCIIFSVFEGIQLFSGSLNQFFRVAVDNILVGGASFHFWYIPVLVGLFVLTPLIDWIVAQSWGTWVIAAAMVVPLFLNRTFPDNSPQNVVVFMAPYTFGIWLGADYDKRMAQLRLYLVPLIAVVIASSIATTLVFEAYVGPLVMAGEQWEGPINWYESISYIQKMTLACIVLLWLKAHDSWQPRWLEMLATYAFAIYFLHVAVFVVVLEALIGLGVKITPVWMHIITVPVIWIVVLAISLGIAVLVRKLAGKRSRMMIGA